MVQTDASGRRADYHGLRHTFAKRLDAAGCSHATRRALMHHGAGDQTDGYTLARLSEMYDAVKRLPSPTDAKNSQSQVRTGTNDSVDTVWTRSVPASAVTGRNMPNDPAFGHYFPRKKGFRRQSAVFGGVRLATTIKPR